MRFGLGFRSGCGEPSHTNAKANGIANWCMTVIYLSEPARAACGLLAQDMDHSVARHSQADSGHAVSKPRRVSGLPSNCSVVRLDVPPFLPRFVLPHGQRCCGLISGIRR